MLKPRSNGHLSVYVIILIKIFQRRYFRKMYIYLTIVILRGRAGYEMIITNEARSAELVMIISYPASPSRIIVLLIRHIIENLKEKMKERNVASEKTERKESFFESLISEAESSAGIKQIFNVSI